MARPLRIELPGATYHVTSRGNEKRDIFFDDADRRAFLAWLGRTIPRYGWICVAYCLMRNHYHLVVTTPEPNLSRGMKYLNSAYVQGLNCRRGRVGRLFDNRFKSCIVLTEEHILNAIRYVAWNPVKDGFCAEPLDWPWSSHAAALGLKRSTVLHADALLSYFGVSRSAARAAYRAFVDEGCDWDPTDAVIRGEAEQATSLLTERPPPEIPRRMWSDARPALETVLDDPDIELAIARAFRRYGYTMKEIAVKLGCHASTVSRKLASAEARSGDV